MQSLNVPNRLLTFLLIIVFILPFFGIVYSNTTYAAITITVNGTADGDLATLNGNGTCDLREAVEAANTNTTVGECVHDGSAGTDTLEFAVNGSFTRTVAPALTISDAVQIIGNGAANTILNKSSSVEGRILTIDNSGEVLIERVTISDGDISTGSRFGGGISVSGLSAVTIRNSVLKDNKSVRSGGAIYIAKSASLTLENSIVDGNESVIEGGGGVMADDRASLTVTNSTISNNFAYIGGGIGNRGETYISQSTISGNKSKNKGGGVDGHGTSNLVIENSTISGNESGTTQEVSYGTGGGVNQGEATSVISINNTTIFNNWNDDGGGGIRRHTGGVDTLTIRNSIIAGNLGSYRGSTGAEDCIDHDGPGIPSSGNNIFIAGGGCVATATDIVLPDVATLLSGLDATLANNGGPTRTHALLAGSAAINSGDPATCLAIDQRGEIRDGQCDIGTYELITVVVGSPSGTSGSSSSSSSSKSDSNGDSQPSGAHISTCLEETGDNTSVSSPVDLTAHGIECQTVGLTGIGVQSVADAGFIRGIDIWGSLNFDVKVCLRGSGSILFLDAKNSPRVSEYVPAAAEDDFTCTTINRAGTVALVTAGGPSPVVVSQSTAPVVTTPVTGTPLPSCRVTTTHMLNFRDDPSANSKVKTVLPYDLTLQAINKTSDWYNVVFGDDNGWISADHVNTRGNCG